MAAPTFTKSASCPDLASEKLETVIRCSIVKISEDRKCRSGTRLSRNLMIAKVVRKARHLLITAAQIKANLGCQSPPAVTLQVTPTSSTVCSTTPDDDSSKGTPQTDQCIHAMDYVDSSTPCHFTNDSSQNQHFISSSTSATQLVTSTSDISQFPQSSPSTNTISDSSPVVRKRRHSDHDIQVQPCTNNTLFRTTSESHITPAQSTPKAARLEFSTSSSPELYSSYHCTSPTTDAENHYPSSEGSLVHSSCTMEATASYSSYSSSGLSVGALSAPLLCLSLNKSDFCNVLPSAGHLVQAST